MLMKTNNITINHRNFELRVMPTLNQ